MSKNQNKSVLERMTVVELQKKCKKNNRKRKKQQLKTIKKEFIEKLTKFYAKKVMSAI